MDTHATPANRIRQFHIRLSESELHQMHERAAAAGCTLSHFVRECGLTGKVSPVPSINRQQWSYLAATTANLNQLTRLCHCGTIPTNLDATLMETARQLQEVRSQLLGGN